MDKLSFERMDHHGIIAGVIRDLGIIEAIDQRLGFGQGEKISYGQAIAAMIINVTEFSDQSLTFIPEALYLMRLVFVALSQLLMLFP